MLSAVAWGSIAQSLDWSPRELEIVQCVFDDLTEAGIAKTLGLSRHTVHTHFERLCRKLGVANRAQLVKRGQAGVLAIPPPEPAFMSSRAVKSAKIGKESAWSSLLPHLELRRW